MKNTIKSFFTNNEWACIILLVLLFLAIRLPGTNLPLHQDEYKWPEIISPTYTGDMEIPHPPLSDFIYRTAGHIVGYDTDFRFVPLFFGTLNLLLLYYFMKIVWGRGVAVIASLIWIFSYFSVLASLMVDTDGQILPFFFLISLIAYYKIPRTEKFSWKWFAVLVLACVGGFLVKFSFLLAIASIIADFLWQKKGTIAQKEIIKYLLYGLGIMIGLGGILFATQSVFPFFDMGAAVAHWNNFINIHRGWFQTLIQCIKSLLHASPILIILPFLNKKKDLSVVRPFIFFLTFAFLFYIVIFDFSAGALDRYLQLLILPLTVFTSLAIAAVAKIDDPRTKKVFWFAIFTGLVLVAFQFIHHYTPTLHPKSEWIDRVMSLRWNFVYPFSGGSGPLGFYVSFLFIALSWSVSLIALIISLKNKQFKKLSAVFLIVIGCVYNFVFIEEYLFGYVNGSAAKLVKYSVEFIKNNSEISKVNPYNDNGGNELKEIGKYSQRLYIDPKFEVNIQERIDHLNLHKEHYLVIDIPRFNNESIYQKFFDTCEVIYQKTDKQTSSTIYDCRQAPNIK